MATAPYTLGGEGLEAHIMDFLNSDSIEQGHFVERNTSIPSIPFSSFSIPLDLIQGEKEDNAYAALLKDHTANSTATAAPYLSRTSRTESSSSHSRKENAQSTKRKFLVDIDSQNGVDSEDEFAHICRRLVSPRRNTSSKTHRATHVHNLSEKRRRNRINEKMKALQLLIPNSQKTKLPFSTKQSSTSNSFNFKYKCFPLQIR
ncbi:transcription factor PIF3-like isoform X2 [Cryptomeria japonica]|uniref:transcription factor PIF3-like isoform X2 n=1 Tax=Cryptomeria japonica TaxID=3369 RepID=UPI0027DA0E47|nr:transcription factor PIF3-like isoform X2 [Cryptomeria japonica]